MQWNIPNNTQMIRGIPIGRLDDVDRRTKKIELNYWSADTGTAGKLTVSSTPPPNPQINDLWYYTG